MAFKDYSLTPASNTALGDGTYVGANMLRNKVRPAFQQIMADGRELYDELEARVLLAKGDKGDLAGIGYLFTDTWPAQGASTTVIITGGYSVAGKGGAKYIKDGTSTWSTIATTKRTAAIAAGISAATVDASLAATEGRWRKADASGQYWTLSPDQEVCDTMFGALHNAVYNGASAWNARWTGNDDQPAIQAMLDWAAYFGGRSTVRMAPGPFLIGKTLHMGYGDDPVHLELRGPGRGFAPGYGNQPYLVRNFCGQPGINVQGGLNVVIENIGSWGVHADYFNTNGFAQVGKSCPVDDTDLTNWYDPTVQTAIGKSVDARYSPDCFVCIDGYSGTGVAGSYTPPTYPAWLGAASLTQWNKYVSSNVRIDGYSCRGEINVVAVQPGGSDGNGDFVQLGKGNVVYSKRVLSVAQIQARSNVIEYLGGSGLGEIVANNVHGLQNGTLQLYAKVSVSGIIRSCSISGTGGTVMFMPSSKFEAAYQLADSSFGSLSFDHCAADFELQGDRTGTANRPIPFAMISGNATSDTTINGGSYVGFKGLFIGMGRGRVIEGALIDGNLLGQNVGTLSQAYSVANNATMGGVIFLGGSVGSWDSQFAQRSISAGTATLIAACEGMGDVDRDKCLPLHLAFARQPLEPGQSVYVQRADSLVYAGASGRYLHSQQYALDKAVAPVTGTPSSTKYEMSWTFPYNVEDAEFVAGAAGDIVIDYAAQVAFIIRSYNGPLASSTRATIAVAVNGLKYTGGNYTPINAITTGSGTLYIYNTRHYLPAMPMFVTTTTANGNLTAVGSRKGDVMGTAIATGDYVDVDAYNNNLIPVATSSLSARITAFNSAALTATVGSTPTRAATEQVKRLVRTVANS